MCKVYTSDDYNYSELRGKYTLDEMYMKENLPYDATDKNINDIINDAFYSVMNIKIEDMTDEEVKLLDEVAKDSDANVFINCLLALEGINRHICALLSANRKQGGKCLKGNMTLYEDLSVMADCISDIICNILMSFPKKDDYFTFKDYNDYVVPVINNFLRVVKEIERNKISTQKIPLVIYTTKKYFNYSKYIIFKIEYRKQSVADKLTWCKVARSLWERATANADAMEKLVYKASEIYIKEVEYEKTIKNSTAGKIFVKELFSGGVLNEIIDTCKSNSDEKKEIEKIAKNAEVALKFGGALMSGGTVAVAGEVAKSYLLSADNIKNSITIIDRVTGTYKDATATAIRLTKTAKTASNITKVAKISNYTNIALIAGDVAFSGYKTYKKCRLIHCLSNDIFGIDEEFYDIECNFVYRDR